MNHLKHFPLLVAVMFCAASYVFSQTLSEHPPTHKGVISGRVTIDGKPAQGIIVVALPDDSDIRAFRQFVAKGVPFPKVSTNDDGTFRFNGIEAGRYKLSVHAPTMLYVVGQDNESIDKTFTVGKDDVIENINFALIRGGVITGRVIDADGKPVIGEVVNAIRQRGSDKEPYQRRVTGGIESFLTDDRGIYRIYGLANGRYKIAVGGDSTFPGQSVQRGKRARQTYYPGVADASAAKEVEITDANEVQGVDIKVEAVPSTYAISGRVIDAETGKPVPHAVVKYSSFGTSFNPLSISANAQGEFKIQGVRNNNYMLEAVNPSDEAKDYYSEKAEFNLKDANVENIEIRLHQAVTISGQAFIDGSSDPMYMEKLSQATISAVSRDEGSGSLLKNSTDSVARIGADGNFIFRGLMPGSAYIRPMVYSGLPGFWITKVERTGANKELKLSRGEAINDVRLYVAPRTCKIRGQVKIIGGTLPAGTSLDVSFYRLINGESDYPYNAKNNTSVEVDANGRFIIEYLIAGDYELGVSTQTANPSEKAKYSAPQNVSLSIGQELEMEIVWDLKAKNQDN
ncbi:MAG: carboxypeptidase regulatory-like domain-containing protein [Acidobacteriota bacterium]